MRVQESVRHGSRVAVLTFLLNLLSGLASGVACAADRFVLQRGPHGYWHLSKPSHVTVALRDSAPTFQPWPDSAYARSVRSSFPCDERTTPFAIIRDVNGDGIEDRVLDGRTEQGTLEVGKAADSTDVFTWGAIKDDPSHHFTWSDSLGLRSWEN